MNTIIISDIHIGTNEKTCWYQKSVHEPYMLALLDYIIQHANKGGDSIDRLIILGDLFDFWTYPPSMVPPTVDAILAANPALFGPDGKLGQVVKALKGNVQYIHGNHDMTLTQDDLNRIPTGQHKIKLLPDVYPDTSGILFTHGHLGTMFNAPDPRYPGQVPVGYFVTRAIAYMLNETLKSGETAADLPNQGSPYGFSLSHLIPDLPSQIADPSVTNFLLDLISHRCKLDKDQPIMMSDKTQMTINAAKKKYDGLWAQWVKKSGGGEVGLTTAAKSAWADYDGTYMAWFAQKFAFESNSIGAVLGHTHVPRVGIKHSFCQYINSGFECPSIPDITSNKTHWNFTQVGSNGTMQLWQIVQTKNMAYQVQPADAPQDQLVYAPAMDYSCYVKITNKGSSDLVMQHSEAQHGFFVVPPPLKIAVNTTAEIWIQDLFGANGSGGEVTYRQADESGSMSFTFGCPTGAARNHATGGADFIATSGNPPQSNSPHRKVPHWGHPLFVEFFTAV